MMNHKTRTFKSIDLNSVSLDSVVKKTYEAFKNDGAPANGLRSADYKRWSCVLERIGGGGELLDIGIGMGQFVDAAVRTGRFTRVRGADRKPHTGLRNLSGFEYITCDLTNAPSDLTADVVTCMECLEHIASPGFTRAVDALKSMARRQLIVTVPFEEPEPLPSYHVQRFDAKRLTELFPGAECIIVGTWVIVDWKVKSDLGS